MKTKNPNDYLVRWLSDDRARAYFGPHFAVKVDVLLHVLNGTGGSLADIAREHGISRQAVRKHRQRAWRIYVAPQPKVDCRD